MCVLRRDGVNALRLNYHEIVQSMPSAKQVAGRYQVEELLGRGGMGEVYRVVDQRDGRELALKRLNVARSSEPVAAELFEREFHTLSELAHPRIIEVYDYGVDTDGAYYTMELLGGLDLRALGKLPWRRACELLRDVASSLAILHSRRLLHGDLSPRNVRCTADGRAKLLDFGAMVPMGAAKRIVGTPPFIAPEMMQLQALDARTDLFALGALAYWMLTGRHAYPAQVVTQLRDLWRKTVPAPHVFEPEIPAALSELVMELLQLARNARPRSAGVVMERLCAIAALPLEEQRDVAQAYLTTPVLVGRDTQLAAARDRLLATLRGAGCVLLVQGPSGSGRSRFLDACVLEAKLLGSHVIRTDLGDLEDGRYGVAAALCRQLFELAPETAAPAARLHGPVLAHVLGAELVQAEPCQPAPERMKLQMSLRDFVLGVARSLRIVIAVDDADRIDEASASVLTALAQKAHRRSLCMILAADSEGEGSAALDLLGSKAERIELPPLSEAQTEQLLGSVFGGAGNTLTVAGRIQAIARGNPRAIMQLAQHLVDQRIARYEAGQFLLPERVLEQDLPPSIQAAQERRVSTLDADALELGRALALTDPSELPTASYVELTAHGDRARTYRAIDHLVRAQLLEPQGDRFRLSDATSAAVLCAGLSAAERVALHRRLARVFEHGGTLTRRSFHLMESDQPEAAIRLILAQYLKDPNEPRHPLEDYVSGALELLERAALTAETLRLPAPLRVELRMKVAGASQFLGDLPRFLRIAPDTLTMLERDSGLTEYHALDPARPPMERLTDALTRTQQRYEATPERERGLPPADAIRELARICAMFSGMAAVAQEGSLLDIVPSLEPFVPLSPAIGAIAQFVDAMRALMQGRDFRAREMLLRLAEQLKQSDGAGLGALYSKALRMGAAYSVAMIEASAGIPDAGLRVAEHEREPGNRVNAQRVHVCCHLMQGDSEAAAAAQRRAELVMLQDGQPQRQPGTTVRTEVYAYSLAEDAVSLKQVVDRIARMGESVPGWHVFLQLARARYKSMQGDHAGALSALEPALLLARPLAHRDWAWLVAAQSQALVGLGRAEEAVALGQAHLELCEREQLGGESRVAQALAEALLAAGRPEQAEPLAERLTEQAFERGARGILLGSLYELQARIALALDDIEAYRGFAERCAAEYRVERNPTLAARFERLRRDAAQRGMAPLISQRPPAPLPESTTAFSTVHSRLLDCPDASARARCVLTILAEHMDAERAFLYGVRSGQLQFLCALPEGSASAELHAAVESYFARRLTDESGESAENTLSTQSGERVFALLLTSKSEGQSVIAGVAALTQRGRAHEAPSPAMVEALACALLDNDDVDPVTRVL